MAQELSRLLSPESVAIIGVSENPSRIGGRLFKYLTKHGQRCPEIQIKKRQISMFKGFERCLGRCWNKGVSLWVKL